ncbi:MAG: type II CAAX endopeptidase family protein [Candidatus Lokiarchaeia archaeon]
MSKLEYLDQSDRSIVQFVLITFTFSWLFWIPGLLFSRGLGGNLQTHNILVIIGSFGPFIASFSLTYKKRGIRGVISLWRKGWHCEKKLYLIISLVLIPIICGLALFLTSFSEEVKISSFLTGNRMQYGYLFFEILTIFFLGGPFQEEFGWRGFALNRLQSKWNALESSIILGSIWSVWHFPLFFIPGTIYANQSFFSFTTSVLALSIFFTWLYNNTNGSILASMLFHTSINATQVLFLQNLSFLGTVYFIILLDVIMVLIIAIYGKEELKWTKNKRKILVIPELPHLKSQES